MNIKYFSIAGYFILMLFFPPSAGAESLSGKAHLSNQNILISGPQKYQGQIDLRSHLPMGDEFALTKVIVSFMFQDDKEWVRATGESSLQDTGKIIRHSGSAFRKKEVSGQTDYLYVSRDIVDLTNEGEVAELTIGRNIFYGTTLRRRDVTKEILGQKSLLLGTYNDAGDNGRLRQHYRLTDEILETRQDGYDGPFEIRHKYLDLSAVQDIARTGILDFELAAGEGDYIFVEARVSFAGHIMGRQAAPEHADPFIKPIWLAMIGLPLGGVVWWKKNRVASAQKQPGRNRRRLTRQPLGVK